MPRTNALAYFAAAPGCTTSTPKVFFSVETFFDAVKVRDHQNLGFNFSAASGSTFLQQNAFKK
jgi:hypothetical protein